MQEKEPIIDIKSQPTVKKHGYTEEENREIMHKQMSAMRKLKADFGLEGIQSGAGGAKDTQMHEVKSRCESWVSMWKPTSHRTRKHLSKVKSRPGK